MLSLAQVAAVVWLPSQARELLHASGEVKKTRKQKHLKKKKANQEMRQEVKAAQTRMMKVGVKRV